METLTCVAFLANKSNGIPKMIMVTNDHRLWLNQPFATVERVVRLIDAFHFDPKKPHKKLFSLLVDQLKELQLVTEGDRVKLHQGRPFNFEADSRCIGGVIRCFRPEEGPYALRLPLYGSSEHAIVGGFANRASALAWILTVESSLRSIGIALDRDWYQVLPA